MRPTRQNVFIFRPGRPERSPGRFTSFLHTLLTVSAVYRSRTENKNRLTAGKSPVFVSCHGRIPWHFCISGRLSAGTDNGFRFSTGFLPPAARASRLSSLLIKKPPAFCRRFCILICFQIFLSCLKTVCATVRAELPQRPSRLPSFMTAGFTGRMNSPAYSATLAPKPRLKSKTPYPSSSGWYLPEMPPKE